MIQIQKITYNFTMFTVDKITEIFYTVNCFCIFFVRLLIRYAVYLYRVSPCCLSLLSRDALLSASAVHVNTLYQQLSRAILTRDVRCLLSAVDNFSCAMLKNTYDDRFLFADIMSKSTSHKRATTHIFPFFSTSNTLQPYTKLSSSLVPP